MTRTDGRKDTGDARWRTKVTPAVDVVLGQLRDPGDDVEWVAKNVTGFDKYTFPDPKIEPICLIHHTRDTWPCNVAQAMAKKLSHRYR